MTKNIECVGDVIERIDSTRTDLDYNQCWYKENFQDTLSKEKYICKGTGYMNSTAKNNIIWQTWDCSWLQRSSLISCPKITKMIFGTIQ